MNTNNKLTNYVMQALKEEFIQNARLFIFETYCRIHQCIDIKMLSEKLNMGQVRPPKSIRYQQQLQHPIPFQKWPIPGTHNKSTVGYVGVLIHGIGLES